MVLDKETQSFNTGPPQYAASEITVSLESVEATAGGMVVTVGLSNRVQNGRGFFPSYTVTVTAGGESKQQQTDVFPGQPRSLTFEFSTTASVEVEANPGRNVESLFLSAGKPSAPSIQPPTTTAEAGAGTATVTYTVANDGNAEGTVDLEITASGPSIETATTTQTETVPPGREVSGEVTFEFDVDSPTDVEICVRAL